MKIVLRFLKRIGLALISFTFFWFITSQVFERLDQQLPLFMALILAYFASAYFILPRLIHLFLLIFRRGRIPRFTRAGDGFYTDPVNLILLGTQTELKTVFKKIGWNVADKLTPKSILKMIRTFILNKPYPQAPFGFFFLFGRKQDIGFQQAIGHSPRQRHHIRFWATNTDEFINPLDIKYWTKKQKIDYSKTFAWIGACSEDLGFGLTKFTYQITHRINPNIDQEREYILSILKQANCLKEIVYYNPGTFKVGKYTSDGRIAVAVLRS